MEDMLLSKQPADLGNYTFVTIFVDKVFTDPNRKRRIRKIILVSVIVLVIIVVIALVIWLLYTASGYRRLQEQSFLKCTDGIPSRIPAMYKDYSAPHVWTVRRTGKQ